MIRLRWLLTLLLLLGASGFLVGQAIDPSVATFPKLRWAGGTAGMLTEVDSTNHLLVTLTGTPAAQADSHEPSVATFPRVRIAGGTSGNLAEVDSTGHLLVTGLSTSIADADYGDITVSSSSTVWTIDTSVVTNAKIADMAESTIKGRAVGAGTGAPQDLTATQATAILNPMVGDSGAGGTKGLVPAPAAGDAAATKFLKADGTWATAGGVSGGAANKVAYWTGATSLSNDTEWHYDATNNIIGFGGTTAAAGTGGNVVLTLYGPGLGNAVAPTTAVTDAVQLYPFDYAATKAGLAIKTEDNIDIVFAESMLHGTLTKSSTMTRGLYLEQAGHDNGALQLGSNLDIAHGITTLGLTSMYGDFRKIVGADGGLQMRGITEATMGLFLSSIVTTETSTKSASADAAVIVEVGLKDTTTVQGMSADSNLFAVQNRFAASPTKFLVDNDGDTWQPGGATVQRTLEANTAGSGAPNVLGATTESNKILTNEGSTAQNYHTLPAAAVTSGTVPQFTFIVQDADGLRITAGAGDTVRIAAAVSGAAGRCESTTIGDSVTLVAINATEWMAIAVVGAGWTCT